MNAKKIFGTLGAVLMVLVVLAVSATAIQVPVDIENVELNDVKVVSGSTTRLSVLRNDQLEVKVELFANSNGDNLELQAFLSGYEYSDVEPVSVATAVFSVEKDNRYVKRLNLRLPENLERDSYKLRLVISDRNAETLVKEYSLSIDAQRHKLRLEDILLTPAGSVRAGDALLVKVRLQNKGEKDEKDVKATVSLSDLAKASAYIDRIKSEDEKETEELFLRVPKCTKAGSYPLRVDIEYSEGRQKLSAVKDVKVESNDSCEEKTAVAQSPSVATPATQQTPLQSDSPNDASKLRKALEVVLLVVVALLVVIGLILGFSKLRSEDED